MNKLSLDELIDLALERNIKISRKDNKRDILFKLGYKNNTVFIPNDIKREINLYLPIDDIMNKNINDKKVWQMLLERDYKIKEYKNPYDKYIDLYERPYKNVIRYYHILKYLIYILLELYQFNKNGLISSSINHRNNIITNSINDFIEGQIDNEDITFEEYFKLYGELLSDYERKLMLNDDKNILFIDQRLVKIKFINLSGYNKDPRAHLNLQTIIDSDKKYWKKYKGIFEINNRNGISLYDIIYGIYMIKSAKFANLEEMFHRVEKIKITDLPNNKKEMEIKISFDHTS